MFYLNEHSGRIKFGCVPLGNVGGERAPREFDAIECVRAASVEERRLFMSGRQGWH